MRRGLYGCDLGEYLGGLARALHRCAPPWRLYMGGFAMCSAFAPWRHRSLCARELGYHERLRIGAGSENRDGLLALPLIYAHGHTGCSFRLVDAANNFYAHTNSHLT